MRPALFGDNRGRGSLFKGGKGLNPFVLSEAPFAVPRVNTTFIISHNISDLNPISRQAPRGVFDGPLPSLNSYSDRRLDYALST